MPSSILPVGLKTPLTTKIYPNGEFVVYRNKEARVRFSPSVPRTDKDIFTWAFWQLYCSDRKTAKICALFMGLSLLRNFDKLAKDSEGRLCQLAPAPIPKSRRGLKGIPRTAARTVRCACYLLEREVGKQNLTFATVTVPPMPVEQMRALHSQWNKVVELYILGLRRQLQKHGLSGEIVAVSEFQEKRHQKTGIPVLHLHSVFQGREPYSSWVVTTKMHDRLWKNAVTAVVGDIPISFKSAANLKQVRASAMAYLSKYMSKGAACVAQLVSQGFADWLPRQWWNLTRSLSRRVKAKTVVSQSVGQFLLDIGLRDDCKIFDFVGHKHIDLPGGFKYWLATFGRLNPSFQLNELPTLLEYT